MRAIVVGLGTQGYKRMRVAGSMVVASVDPANDEADYKELDAVPLADFDAAFVCVPDEAKLEILEYLAGNGKHILVEKPILLKNQDDFAALQATARGKNSVIYTAYNHRFEPHYIRMRELIASGELGRIYRCRMFYGNGTARLVRGSPWRDAGGGVLPDLGSHLLDTVRFWFGEIAGDFTVVSAERFENRAPDHVVIANRSSSPRIELEMTLLSWRNDFVCDILAEKGSAHIRSLCKWGPATFTKRIRVLPSGRPPEEAVTLAMDDPTWEAELRHFEGLVENGVQADLESDAWLNRTLSRLTDEAIGIVAV